MKKAFLSVSFKNRRHLQSVIDTISSLLFQFDYNLHVFVDEYSFGVGEEEKMMNLACSEIESSDLIIAEVSDKAIGVGIEVGYAVALKKTVLYLRNVNSEYSSTIGGIVKQHIIYSDIDKLKSELEKFIKSI